MRCRTITVIVITLKSEPAPALSFPYYHDFFTIFLIALCTDITTEPAPVEQYKSTGGPVHQNF